MKVHNNGNVATALAKLRQHLADIEREISLVEHDVQQKLASAFVCEKRAMSAIRRGDDWTARQALMHQGEHMDAAALPQADLNILKALAEECHLAIVEAEQRQSAVRSTEPR